MDPFEKQDVNDDPALNPSDSREGEEDQLQILRHGSRAAIRRKPLDRQIDHPGAHQHCGVCLPQGWASFTDPARRHAMIRDLLLSIALYGGVSR
jgi:hypothetical protein